MPKYVYYQKDGGSEVWKPAPASHIAEIRNDKKPIFTTVLSVDKLVEELSYEDKQKLKYSGPMYYDWDSPDIETAIEKTNVFVEKLLVMELDFGMVQLYATGGKGFHLEIPQAVFDPKPPREGVQNLPAIYREVALELIVDTLDMRVYSQGRGRMWRETNVKRENGSYKVPISLQELQEMTPESYARLTSTPRPLPLPKIPSLCLDLSILYSKCKEKVDEKIKKRSKVKPDPRAIEKAKSASIGFMMAGKGIKDSAGFNEVAMQLGIAAHTAGTKLEDFLSDCEGLILSEGIEWNRYNSPQRRRDQLAEMYHYTQDNPCYLFSIGAVKALLSHSAPDLDGIETTSEDIEEVIAESKTQSTEIDEYADVAAGVDLSKYGTYVTTDFGKKRVCAVSFANITLLKSLETGQISGYSTDVLVNGKPTGRQTLEMDLFSSLAIYNRFCSRLGHAFQGNDIQLRGLMMRFVEQAKRKGNMQYVVEREGLDVVNIPGHEDEELRKPFLVWADRNGVEIQANLRSKNVQLSFQGHPEPQGVFKTDLTEAPVLHEWIKEVGNKEALRNTLKNLMTMQRPEMLGKMIGWHFSCHWRQMFHKCYTKFPLLHVVGAAGSGKSEMMLAMQGLFFYNQEPKPLTPGSSVYGLQRSSTASASIPLMVDEYKPNELSREVHNRIKLMFRDAYNCRDVVRGGGNRDSDDYRSLHSTQIASPVLFIAEAMEDETAVLERVVLLTIVRPPQQIAVTWRDRFFAVKRTKHLSILGKAVAAWIIEDSSLEEFQSEFDALYTEACEKYLISAKDLKGTDHATLEEKQNNKERSVFNHTVALFGLRQYASLVRIIYGDEFDELIADMERGIYSRLSDLTISTTPEYLKVISMISTMSHHVDSERSDAVREGYEYAFTNFGSKQSIEISMTACYMKYRVFCKATGVSPLFSSPANFMYAVKDSPALLKQGLGEKLHTPGIFTMDMDELARLGVDSFKS